jgi:hypothetical protein
MKNLTLKLNRVLNILNSRSGRLVVLIVVLSLFILSAGAPNAMIGIGK